MSTTESTASGEKAAMTGRTVHVCAANEDETIVDALRKPLTDIRVTDADEILLGEDPAPAAESAWRQRP